MTDRYKVAVILGFFGLAIIALVGIIIISSVRPDATASMLNAAVVLLGIASPFAVTFYMLQKQGAKLEQVEKQTNGNLSKKEEELTELRAQLAAYETKKTPPKSTQKTGEKQ